MNPSLIKSEIEERVRKKTLWARSDMFPQFMAFHIC